MDTKPFQRFEPARFLSIMHQHSNKIIGMWFRVWCTLSLSKTRWTFKGDLDAWCRVLGENKAETRKFINYSKDHIPDLLVLSEFSQKEAATFTMIDEYYSIKEDIAETRRVRARKFTRSDLIKNRAEIKAEILKAYHPKKINIQPSMFENNFVQVMRDASRDLITSDHKIEKEREQLAVILNHIKFLETTDEWDEDGRFLLGLGRYFQSRQWEYDERFLNKEPASKSKKNVIADAIERR